MQKFLNLILRTFIRFLWGKARILFLRKMGVKIGKDCLIFCADFSTEPFLIELGNHVTVSHGVRMITHDGGVWIFRKEYPNLDIFGKISIGDNTCIGMNAIILPNTKIGQNCIVGAGSVVKGQFPDNSLIMGNPAKVVMSTQIQKKLYLMSSMRINTKGLNFGKKRKAIIKHFANK
jgi:acetyltransferase-like isoleucine patch superfamily enzyme